MSKSWWNKYENKNQHTTSIPFCLNFPNILALNNAKYGLIRAEIHLKDWNSIQGNAIDVQLDKDNFINESRDGYIVYCFCKGKEKNATKI